ncbi:MAG: tRNA 2-thiocytidine biosynthesis TtcA family protein [Tenericutes bacterium]|nr:tRNA 2-thiocytidine biosynthesis TtcA family protein [Mycoplasmatota bacterium]
MNELEIKKSIIKKFRKEIWSKFIKAIKDYELIKENDNICVCISGGKDSFLLALCFEELKKHHKFNFNTKYLVMDPGYLDINLKQIEDNAKLLNLDIEVFKSDIFDVVDKVGGSSPCYLCARMRRGYLYAKAKELGCNKIALGHHFNDVIETVMLNILYNGVFGGMLPILDSKNFEGMQLIRPLYYIKEKDIIHFVKYNNLKFIDCACKVTKKNLGKRKEVKLLIEELVKTNKNADINIMNSLKNVNKETILGYMENGE